MTASPISRLICSHDFFWSRKRQADVCRRCGAISPVLALHFRSKSAWTVGADLPPERANDAEASDLTGAGPFAGIEAFVSEPIAWPTHEPTDFASLPAPDGGAETPPATEAPSAVQPEPEPIWSDPFSRPLSSTPVTDFSSHAAAPLRHSLVT